tara:strand:+ start:229 stop:399 length:171 start_codon:yes stop_codon:yes gene_type:complete
MKLQCEEINKHKWIESEKAGFDLKDIACQDWIHKYAKQYKIWALKQPRLYEENNEE